MAPLDAHGRILAAGGELVTATPRQAEVLKATLGRREAARGRRVWQAPRITPHGAWLAGELRRLDDRPELLDARVERRLWLQVVADSEVGARLLNPRAAAAEAAHAWALAQAWRLPIGAMPASGPDEAAFLGWAADFERRTAALGVIDAARVPALLAARQARGASTPVGFHGFAECTPARRALGTALARAGRAVEEVAVDGAPATPRAVAAASPDAELDLIVEWCVSRFAADPEARLVVLLPDLAVHGESLARRLDDALVPQCLLPGGHAARPYALGSGGPLAASAVVQAALDILAWGAGSIDLFEFGRVLRGPYLPGEEAEGWARAELDLRLRAQGARRLPGAELARRLRPLGAAGEEMAIRLEAVRRELDPRRPRAPGDWAEAFTRALRAAGWARGRALGEEEYAAARAALDVIAALGGLARLVPRLGFGEARAELAAALEAATLGAPADVPVLVQEALEDPALPCDGLWVAGLTADRFPGTARTTPLVPPALQRAGGVPAASAEGMLARGQAALAGWLRAAPEVVLSAPRQDGEAHLVRSALVPPAGEIAVPRAPFGRALEVRAATGVEPYSEQVALRPLPGPVLPGGVRVLELQSECPFRAQALLRLGARAPESPRAGLAARLRGVLAHEALAVFWRGMRDQATLEAASPAARREAASAAVDAAIAAQGAVPVEPRLLALERDWLVEAIDGLAARELEREPFEAVALESAGELDLAGHRLGIRIDRMDRLQDGSVVLIDYKTGRRTPKRWVGPRPDGMQLAAYALSRPEPAAAVALALLPPDQRRFAGVAARKGVLPRIGAVGSGRAGGLSGYDWPALLERWRELAGELVLAHASGDARVDPAPGACEQCELGILCRIAPGEADADEGGEDEGGGDDG